MTRGPRCSPRTQAALGLALCVVLAWPPLRHALEASVWRHMVLQFPLLMAAGALLAAALPPRARGAVARWNAHGIAGLVGVAGVLAVLMVPRALDLALRDGAIEKTYRFGNFHETMAFVNALAWIAHAEDHHPDLALSYGRCTVRFNTHSVGGISINDFICAAKVDALLP